MSDAPQQTPSGGDSGGAGPDPDALDRSVATAAMRLAAEKGWGKVGLLEVARAAGVPLSAFHHRYPGRADLLAALSRVADATVLAGGTAGATVTDPAETTRDRLFDVMMRRFDALLPFREGLRAVVSDLPGEPGTALAFLCSFRRSMAWMLRGAGIDPDRRGGPVQVAVLGAVQARVMRVFLDDDSADLSRTMAALDTELKRIEGWAATFCRWTGKNIQRAEPSAASTG